MSDNKRSMLRRAKAGLKEHKAMPDKSTESAIIEAQIADFLGKGGEIGVIPSSYSRSYEEMSMMAQQQRNSLNKEQQERFNKRQKAAQAKTASIRHLTNRTVLPDYIK